ASRDRGECGTPGLDHGASVGAAGVRRGIRREATGEGQGCSHENGMDKSSRVDSPRREATRWNHREVVRRSGHSERFVPERIYEAGSTPWNRNRCGWLSIEGWVTASKWTRPHSP